MIWKLIGRIEYYFKHFKFNTLVYELENKVEISFHLFFSSYKSLLPTVQSQIKTTSSLSPTDLHMRKKKVSLESLTFAFVGSRNS